MEMNRATRWNLRLQSASTGLILAGLLILAAYASQRYQLRWDWTVGNRHTLAEQSAKAVRGFSKGLTVTAYVQERGDQRTQIESLLEKYRVLNPDLDVRFVDPDLDPAAARRADVAIYGTLVFRSGKKSEKITETSEEAVTNALIRLAKGSAKTVRILQGHGEHPLAGDGGAAGPGGAKGGDPRAYSQAVTLLKGEGYQVESLMLAEVEAVPPETAALILAGPRKPLLPIEVERLQAWFGKGGRLLVMSDPGTETGVDKLLKTHGVTLEAGLVIDPVARLFRSSPTTPLISQYDKNHPITRGLSAASFFPEARGLKLEPAASGSKQTRTQLLLGAERGWLEKGPIDSGSVDFDAETDVKGPILLGVAVQEEANRLLILGDSDFAGDAYISLSGNTDLFLNMVRWLAEDEDFIAIKPKEIQDSGLTLTQGQGIVLFWTLVVAIPLVLLVAGLLIWRSRKRR